MITKVYAGDTHALAITSLGRVFAWGGNEYGQLSINNNIDTTKPVDITMNFQLYPTEEIISMALGNNHCIAITNHGRVFTWGLNNHGQLGNGLNTGNNKNSIPTDITFGLNLDLSKLEYPKYVYARGYSSIIVTSENRILVFGDNASNKLGTDDHQRDYLLPYDITEKFNFLIDEEVVGLSLSSNNGGLFTSSNRVFTWGFNGSGELGLGRTSARENV